jgi:hypothetical protein
MRGSAQPQEGARGQGRGDLDPNTGSASSAVSAVLWKALGPGLVAVTILMRKSVKRAVRRRLEDEEQGRDLSTLIDNLLI